MSRDLDYLTGSGAIDVAEWNVRDNVLLREVETNEFLHQLNERGFVSWDIIDRGVTGFPRFCSGVGWEEHIILFEAASQDAENSNIMSAYWDEYYRVRGEFASLDLTRSSNYMHVWTLRNLFRDLGWEGYFNEQGRIRFGLRVTDPIYGVRRDWVPY